MKEERHKKQGKGGRRDNDYVLNSNRMALAIESIYSPSTSNDGQISNFSNSGHHKYSMS